MIGWIAWAVIVWVLGAGVATWRTNDSKWNGWRIAMVVLWPVFVALYAIMLIGLLARGDA